MLCLGYLCRERRVPSLDGVGGRLGRRRSRGGRRGRLLERGLFLVLGLG
jgi:hypothetical protein